MKGGEWGEGVVSTCFFLQYLQAMQDQDSLISKDIFHGPVSIALELIRKTSVF